MLDWLTLFGRNILDVELLCRSTTSFVANFTEISIGILDPRKNKARQIEMNDTYKFCGSTVRAGRRILAKPIRRGSFSAAGRAEGRPAGPPAASLRARVCGACCSRSVCCSSSSSCASSWAARCRFLAAAGRPQDQRRRDRTRSKFRR